MLPVDRPAEPVVARAYLDQLQRSEEVPEPFAADLAAALDRSAALLNDDARDAALAAGLDSLAATLGGESQGDNAIAQRRRAALGKALGEIAARLQ